MAGMNRKEQIAAMRAELLQREEKLRAMRHETQCFRTELRELAQEEADAVLAARIERDKAAAAMHKDKTLSEVGKALGVSGNRARELVNRSRLWKD